MTRRSRRRQSRGTKVIWCACMVAVWLAVGARVVASQPEDDPHHAAMHDMLALREILFAVHQHARDQKTMPSDLGVLLGAVRTRTGASVEDALAGSFTSALDEAPKRLRDDPAGWISQSSSFKYIGRDGIAPEDLADWGELAVAHLRLTDGHVFNSPEFGRIEVFSVAFLDGHVEMLPRDEAEFIINESRQIFDAVATGGELPGKHQIAADLGEVIAAIRAFAEANSGMLPPDLGAALPYVREDDNRLSTPRGRARVFLTPGKAADTFIPEAPTPEWVNRNTSYVYLGDDGLRLALIEDPQRTILVHGREAFEGRKDRRPAMLIPLGYAAGRGDSEAEEYARWLIDQSRRVIEFARSGAPLPEYQHVMRDMRLLHRALTEYAVANDDRLPSDLGALYDYVDDPERVLTDAERAAVFLSPPAEQKTTVPEQPTPEWVLRHADYVYHGDASVSMSRARRASIPYAIIHAPPDQPIRLRSATAFSELMPAVFPAGPQITISDTVDETIANAKSARQEASVK